ncbi:MAG: putative zinc metalloproteinase Mpr protein [bacterium]|nr:putative zinc metalloproteinase Mpr protein [bacterium]
MTSGATMTTEVEPTDEQYTAFRLMFDHFNAALFAGELPRVLLTFSRLGSHRTIAFFIPRHWQRGVDVAKTTHEISLCPAHVAAHAFRDTASSLVHEMCHLWQEEHGTPPRRGYHSREWSEKMLAVGLLPLDVRTGKPAMSAHNMDHEIVTGGAFERAFESLPAAAVLPWSCVAAGPAKTSDDDVGDDNDESGDDAGEAEAPAPAPSRNKVKFTCPECGVNAWGKPSLNLLCDDGHEPARLVVAVGKPAERLELAA